MLKVNVKDVIQKPIIKDTLRLSVETMNGDADGYNNKILDIHEAELQEYEMVVKSFIKVINAYMAKSHNERCNINSKYREFISTVMGEDVNGEWFDLFDDVLGELIPGDPQADYQYSAAYQNHKFTWFDSEGVEHECELTFE